MTLWLHVCTCVVKQHCQVVYLVIKRFNTWLLCCCFLKQETLLKLFQSTQLLNGDLVNKFQWGKQPTQLQHQWIRGVNQRSKHQLSIFYIMGEYPGGTSGVHSFTCKTRYSLLCVTSPDLSALTHGT